MPTEDYETRQGTNSINKKTYHKEQDSMSFFLKKAVLLKKLRLIKWLLKIIREAIIIPYFFSRLIKARQID